MKLQLKRYSKARQRPATNETAAGLLINTGNTKVRFDKKEFANEPINLNGNHFENCKFTQCEMIFNGVGTVGLVGCTFSDCKWSFQGPAADTVAFMKALYAMGGGGKALIEATFKNIAPDVRFRH